ncbi:GNAT family N-acetyltransferase [Pseudobacteroides cellulosolvens]|uniref:GNAT family N-acetyltransferase n=1 Tax=Pseudobacteroides cellulosolvens TaxID=35825 RepID=UPI000567CFB2
MKSVIKLKKDEMHKITFLFEEIKETMIWSCLQGYMGNAWVDNIESPKCAQVLTGDFCVYAGDSHIHEALLLVKNIPAFHKTPFILMVPENELWGALIEKEYEGKYKKYFRYAVKKEKDIFDIAKLQMFVDKLPSQYDLQLIDERLYELVSQEKWSSDLCSQFSSYDDYKNRGIGYAILHLGKPVCGASSYTVYDEGIEIEIDTKEEYRQKGLATICAAKLILECIDRGLYPSWDAANKESLALAEKLGYHFDKEYITYEIDCTKLERT